MANEVNQKNTAVFSDVIMSLASDAASDVEGIEVLRSHNGSKKSIRGGGVSVYFLPNDKVTIDLFVNIEQGRTVPVTIAEVQERVIKEVESATKYRVHSVNVQVVGVIFTA
ncbi:MAG: Asp23/Gls24 family envelope stress response protein [Clostridia bacterium]